MIIKNHLKFRSLCNCCIWFFINTLTHLERKEEDSTLLGPTAGTSSLKSTLNFRVCGSKKHHHNVSLTV